MVTMEPDQVRPSSSIVLFRCHFTTQGSPNRTTSPCPNGNLIASYTNMVCPSPETWPTRRSLLWGPSFGPILRIPKPLYHLVNNIYTTLLSIVLVNLLHFKSNIDIALLSICCSCDLSLKGESRQNGYIDN